MSDRVLRVLQVGAAEVKVCGWRAVVWHSE
jgi:hypothetical protein